MSSRSHWRVDSTRSQTKAITVPRSSKITVEEVDLRQKGIPPASDEQQPILQNWLFSTSLLLSQDFILSLLDQFQNRQLYLGLSWHHRFLFQQFDDQNVYFCFVVWFSEGISHKVFHSLKYFILRFLSYLFLKFILHVFIR